MTAIPEYHKYDGLGLAELVRNKKVSPAELLDEAISRIEARNPRLNAVIYKMYDQARKAALGPLPDGPFKGVPFLLKDMHATVAGVPTASGTRILKDVPQPHDSEIVRRYRSAGVVIMGKTNVPEFSLLPYTEPEAFGAANNPWDLRTHRGWIERRFGCRGRCPHRTAGWRCGRRRLDPHPILLLRRFRIETLARPHPHRSGRG